MSATQTTPASDLPLSEALALAEGDPRRCASWMDRGLPMCKHCRPHEDVYAAAARILAGEVRRLQLLKTSPAGLPAVGLAKAG